VYIPTAYFETTMFNYYLDADRDAHPAAVRAFEAAGRGAIVGYTSIYATDELEDAPEPKQSAMLALIKRYNLHVINISQEIERLADAYLASGIIPAHKRVDALHLASASVSRLDYILTLNFKHMNKRKTRQAVNSVNLNKGYKDITICSPMEVDYEDEGHD